MNAAAVSSGDETRSLFRIMALFSDMAVGPAHLSPHQEQLAAAGDLLAESDLVFTIGAKERTITIDCEFDPEIFEEETVFVWFVF